ncbi:IS200/IS605 family accessory protein TnpB-related protein [Paenibacillus sp. J5C_2022]|uniref:IS200/IS605 family accessory protein TnpB-related protein n=1 Tax=Paenibacillus sp. J5C2022 TaxID=2977129 RepID=UPI0021CE8D18|nr:IS200/IS605 family accessory protein TnpB-related protein [Paenibacillus sp. J5C2022]MCU6713044.1 IS200/IS605 family accessory protein TnpB-related protein [Paenibacillus sp. J5C2022]
MEQGIGVIVIGHNDGWKQASAIGRRNNQVFCHMPHRMLIAMIRYKAAEQGITVTLPEEAYTSKASFLDQDPLPRYREEGEWNFSRRVLNHDLSKEIFDKKIEFERLYQERFKLECNGEMFF